MGKKRTPHALATLSFNYPRRAGSISRRAGNLPVDGARRAGRSSDPKRFLCRAMGYGSLCRRLTNNMRKISAATGISTCGIPSCIGSVANYFKAHGW
ncbi:hypothetical protein ACNKHV_16895 [Shigella flexneri]